MFSASPQREITTDQFDEVHPFEQAELIQHTKHQSGLCGAFTNLWMRGLLKQKSLGKFAQPDRSILVDAVSMENKMVEHERDGGDSNAYAFHDVADSKKEVVDNQQDLQQRLDKSAAALLTYKTRSGIPHQLAFFRRQGKCLGFDSNRFSVGGDCKKVAETLLEIMQRSNPERAVVDYIPGQR